MSDAPPSRAAGTWPAAMAAAVWLAVLALLAWWQVAPPAATADGPADQFSAQRAMAHVSRIAAEPHPAGSAANEQVREYLLEQLRLLDLDPQVHSAPVDPLRGTPYTLHNITARLPGTAGGPALLLAAHYDSSPAAPGAGDDAAGVAALLETLRALRHGPAPAHDILLLLTDAEEQGMLGAKAWVRDHPHLLREIAAVLNLEARGTAGPSYMFETSAGNAELIRAFAQAAPRPMGSSLTYEVYRRLPNNTDFTIFRNAGLLGLNFAFINGFVNYHTPQDIPENLDPRSLQHHGETALSLARFFSEHPPPAGPSEDLIYFSLRPLGLVHYPAAWAWPLTIVASLALLGVIVLGIKRRRVSVRGVLLGAGMFLILAATATELALLLPSLLPAIHNGPLVRPPTGATHNAHLYAWGLVLISLAVAAAGCALWLRWRRIEELTLGAWVVWTIVLIAATAFVPGATFLFTWPLLFAVAGMALWLEGHPAGPVGALAAVVLPSAAGVLVVAPSLFGFFTALNIRQYWIAVALFAFLLALLLPLIAVLLRPSRKLAISALGAAGIGLILLAGLTAPG